MHVPDGFLDVSTSLATGAVAAGAVGFAIQRADREAREAGAPLAGLTAAFVFATQMVNFPVGPGTSGHLMGGALAAGLVGPWTALLCMSVVLVVQALMFADGGLTALGTNITLIGVVTVAVGYLVTRGVAAVLPRTPGSVVPAVAVGAFVSVPAAALAFTGLYAVGGTVDIPLATLATAMLGWHALVGVGEAVITAAVVGAVVATRPDLVYVARSLRPDLVLVGPEGGSTAVPAGEAPAALRVRRPLAGLLAASLVIAGGLSLVASGHPDGLEFVGDRLGFAAAAQDSALAGGPFADYGVRGIESLIGTGIAGTLGVLATIGLGLLAARVARRRNDAAAVDDAVRERAGA